MTRSKRAIRISIAPDKFRHAGSVLHQHAALCRRLQLLAMLAPVVAFGFAFVAMMTVGQFGVEPSWKTDFYVALAVTTLYEALILRRAASATIIRQVRWFAVAGVVLTCFLLGAFILAYAEAGVP